MPYPGEFYPGQYLGPPKVWYPKLEVVDNTARTEITTPDTTTEITTPNTDTDVEV